MELILEDTVVCLKQGIALMARLTPDTFTRAHPSCYDSTIGGHVRHNLDHFFCLEEGLKLGSVDYDARNRDEFLETNPEYAASKMEELIDFLSSIATADLDQPLKVKMDSCADREESNRWSHSSLGRELQFLISHTIHHYALIATLCARDGLELPAEFGVAPSTLRFRKSRDAQCAQ
ncbi:MAG: hypothetical protein O7C75_19055 [Verrucomicrobia bacterium]|nr:hypothetical protein [Verrucomicrobiota bacterium]